jgi:hypothetical protein
MKKDFLDNLKMAFRIVNPWKKRVEKGYGEAMLAETYAEGWNDCLKEIKRRQKKLLSNVGGTLEAMEETNAV